MNTSHNSITKESISWNGRELRDIEGLPDDLSFRRMLTKRFSADHSPFPRGRIRRIIHDQQFPGLLEQAIQNANATFSASSSGSEQADTTTPIAPSYIPERLEPMSRNHETAWHARLLVFEKLLESPDFDQLVREHENKWPWILSFMELGESLPKPTPGPDPEPVWFGLGRSLQNVFGPLMQSVMWVAPIALGTGLVATHIVEKQSEQRLLQPIAISQSDPRLDRIREQMNQIALSLLAIDDTLARTREIVDGLPKIDEISANARQIRGQVQVISNQARNTRKDIISAVNTRADNIVTRISKLGKPGSNTTLTVDSDVLAQLGTVFKDFGQFNLKTPSEGLKVLLGNAPPLSPTATPSGESASSGLRLTLSDSDLNFHQDTYPVQNTSPIETSSPRPPYLLAFEPGHNVIAVPPIVGAQPGWDRASLDLCNETMPYKIVLRQGVRISPGTACQSRNNNTQQLLTVTKTPQYVKEIHAYMSLDTASTRKYWLFGSRRVALQIAPARP